jgi:1,4-dihydroxy-6-naphthoate synthase
MTQTIQLGISTCPNDTFAFHGLINQLVDWQGLYFEIELLDIQELNSRVFSQAFDVAKASFHGAILMGEHYVVLPSGSALGFGVGPLLLASAANTVPKNRSQHVLCPGPHTTATLLYKLFYEDVAEIQHVVFSQIMPNLKNGEADFGVCIHEGRFTWEAEGLFLVEDLGVRWERETAAPLPLGGIVGRRALGNDVLAAAQRVIQDSVLYGLANPEETLPTMRRYAQEFGDDVLMKHVELYVNDWTVDLGEVGRQAIQELAQRTGREFSGQRRKLEVFGG